MIRKNFTPPFFLTRTAIFLLGTLIGASLILILRSQDRYVSSFSRVAVAYDQGKTTTDSPVQQEIFDTLKRIEKQARKFSWFQQLDEYLLIRVRDAGDAKFTIDIKNGNVDIKPGWLTSQKPTLVVDNLHRVNFKRLEQLVSADELDEQGMYEIASALIVPGLKALYNSDVLFLPGDKRFLKLDNFIQVELVNKYGAKDFDGNLIISRATVVNVDGQWLGFEGFQGQPDVRYTVDINQLIHYYYLINYKFRGLSAADLLSRKELFDEYMKLRQETLTYKSY